MPNMSSQIETVLDASLRTQGGTKAQARTVVGMRTVLGLLEKGLSGEEMYSASGYNRQTVQSWRQRYPQFGEEVSRLIARNQKARRESKSIEKHDVLEGLGLVLKYEEELRPVPSLVDWRTEYFGRPTPLHQQLAVQALEDETNLYVFIFGPTGMGKDTLAGDYASRRLCPDRTGRRCAWIMKVGEKGKRRLNRMGRYLTDPAAVREAPDRTPGATKPSRSLIDDYGPFRWEPGMEWEDGEAAYRPPWQSGSMYFVRSTTPEADPNWQAVGLEGALQGDRVDEAVCSDLFDLENQKSPTERTNQLNWFNGILHSRLDEYGRLVVIGNWLPIENNYEKILERYLEDAVELRRIVDGPSVYTKYNNGVAVVMIKAIYTNDEGEECSYWPDRFPLDDHLLSPDGDTTIPVGELDTEKHLELADSGWKMGRGLRSIRAKDPVMFKAMYQQERDPNVEIVDFTDETFEGAWDYSRSFGYPMPSEIRLLGVDPATRYGAGWLLLGADREMGELCVVDFWWGEKLGVSGIKDKLILQPMGRYDPSWLCFEGNKDGAVLADVVIRRAIDASGVSVYTPPVGRERADATVGPGGMASWMRAGKLRIPYQTAEDRVKADQLRSHLLAFDRAPTRSKAGQAGHKPDDLTFALYAAWRKGVTIVDRQMKDTGIIAGVPDAIRRRFDRMSKQSAATRARRRGDKPISDREVVPHPDPLEMILSLGGED